MLRFPVRPPHAAHPLLALVLGCGPAEEQANTFLSVGTEAPELVQAPVLRQPDTDFARLVRILEVATDRPTRITLELDDGVVTRSVAFHALQEEHELPILGLRPDRRTTLRLTLTDAEGRVTRLGRDLTVTTEPLPQSFPLLEAHPVGDPGYTLFAAKTDHVGYGIIVDERGDVVWYTASPVGFTELQLLPDGTLLGIEKTVSVIRADLPGARLDRFTARDLLAGEGLGDVGQLHHDVQPRPEGGFFGIASRSLEVAGYPRSYATACTDDPGRVATINDDLIVEVDETGALVSAWSLAERLDPTRIGFHGLKETQGGFDWAHTNAVSYDPSDDTLLVSLRHQEAVVKVTREGQLVWILGVHDDWPEALRPFLLDPVGEDLVWPFHQHAPKPLPGGRVLLFDNGNERKTPCGNDYAPSPPVRSRPVIFAIDEEAGTVTQEWDFTRRAEGMLFANAMGDADLLPNGNVLAVYGQLVAEEDGRNNANGRGNQSARIVEVDPDGSTVWELAVTSDREHNPFGWNAFRAQRLDALYPEGLATERILGASER